MQQKELFDLVISLGETMLSNGGEIFRTNEMMEHAARQFGLQEFSVFTITNGILASVVVDGQLHSAQVRNVHLLPICLSRVEAMNTLSREIAMGLRTPEETLQRLEEIQKMGLAPRPIRVLCAGIGSGAFSYLVGGSWADCFVAFLAGSSLYAFLSYVCKYIFTSKILSTILSSAVATLVCCVFFSFGTGTQLDMMIIGSIFPLVPGVPLTNSVRNFLESDYLAGTIRLVDALLTAGYIAVGVSSVMYLYSLLGGVAL